MNQDRYRTLCERIDALDAQMKQIRQQQDELTKRRKRIQVQKAQRALNQAQRSTTSK